MRINNYLNSSQLNRFFHTPATDLIIENANLKDLLLKTAIQHFNPDSTRSLEPVEGLVMCLLWNPVPGLAVPAS